jgi:hypothetical protein
MFIGKQRNEACVADGYGNHHVIGFNGETGKYKRHWGAYGYRPDDIGLGNCNPDAPPRQQFRNPGIAPICPPIACCTSATA